MIDGPTQSERLTHPRTGFEQIFTKWARPALVVYWPVLAVATHWPHLDLPNPTIGLLSLDKIEHFVCFGVLAFLLIYAQIRGRSAPLGVNLASGVVVAAIYTVLDETTQFLFDRTVSAMDIVANLTGVFAVSLLIWLVRRARDHRSNAEEGVEHESLEHRRPADSPSQTGGFVGHAVWVGLLTLGSRVLGLVRDAVLAACFGMTTITDAFWIGFIIPNLFRRLFGEGALTAAFIPTYGRLLKEDPIVARRLVSLCVGLLCIVLGAVALGGDLLLGWMMGSGQWSDDTHLAIRLTMVMLPYLPMICVVALLGGVLQVHGRFGSTASAPVLLNLVLILSAGLAVSGVQGDAGLRDAIATVAWSVLAAGVLQVVWQVVAVSRCERFTLQFRGTGPAIRSILMLMGPMVLGLAVFQINTLFDSLVAWGLSPKAGDAGTLSLLGWEVGYPIRSGAVTGLQYSQRLYQFPLGVFGIALATAIFPALTRAAAGRHTTEESKGAVREQGAFREILQQGLRLTVFVGLPASVGLILVRVPLVRVIFERREFLTEDSIRVATILAGYASAVWAYSMAHVLTRAFYAREDSRTPVAIGVWMVGVNLVLNLVLVWPLGAAALAWSTAICAVCQAVLLLRAMGRHVQEPLDRTVWSSWGRSALLTAIMAGVLLPITLVYDPQSLSHTQAGVQLFVMVAAGVAVVFAGARLLGAQELTWLFRGRGSVSK